MKAILIRENFQDLQVTGSFELFDNNDKKVFSCKNLELPWLKNKSQKSCIPEGEYKVVNRQSAQYGNHYHVLDVENRTFILIHPGNYNFDIKGCILLGEKLTDINGDSYKDVTNSVKTIKKLLKLAPKGFDLEIKSKPKKNEIL